MKKILVTGCSGFIGMHLCKSLLKDNFSVTGLDNMNDYYDQKLKEDRLEKIKEYEKFNFYKADISDGGMVDDIFKQEMPEMVVNLAAQAGVRYSLVNPHAYIESNVIGFLNILEASRKNNVKGLVYASSSSVYGGNKKMPFSIDDVVDMPISIYAVSKKSNELMAYTYSHLYDLNTTGLRFFTVYGPWGRPDMAMYIFANKISNDIPLPVYNFGKMKRDFTFIDDIVSGIRSAIEKNYKCEIFNLGNNRCEDLLELIKIMEDCMGKKAKLDFQKIQPGDVTKTYADIQHSTNKLNYLPSTNISTGINEFIKWYTSKGMNYKT